MRAEVPLQGRRIRAGKKPIAQLEATGSPEHFCSLLRSKRPPRSEAQEQQVVSARVPNLWRLLRNNLCARYATIKRALFVPLRTARGSTRPLGGGCRSKL